MSILLAACIVIGVSDGDTVRVKCPQRVAAFPVRISEIDAPEKANRGFGWPAQPFNEESRASLVALCQGKFADVRRTGFDRDRRALGSVSCAGVDVARYQVSAGMAWANTKYLNKTSVIPALEEAARAGLRGLWADDNPVEPWIWRKAKACP